VVFNVANLLLVAAIDVAGLAVAFPVGIGLALIVGAVSSYLVAPAADPWLLFGGVALVTVAIVLDAAAYRKRESEAKVTTTRGIVLSLVAGVLMGTFYPLVARAMSGAPGQPGVTGPGPYAVALFFAVGVLVSTVPANLLLMARPLDGKPPVDGREYARAPLGWHLAGVLGGAIWCTGAVANFVASGAHVVGPAVSYSIGQGATMISACWGVFVWHEFAGAPRASKMLLFLMFVFFLLGLSSVALAPLYKF
jgi:glucose uptake protein